MTYEDILQVAGGGVTLGHLSVRVDDHNPDHHLWNNRGTWWCHFTLHHTNHTSERVRVSLRTRDLEEARDRRDQLLDAVR